MHLNLYRFNWRWNDVIFDWRKYNGMMSAANFFGLCSTKHRQWGCLARMEKQGWLFLLSIMSHPATNTGKMPDDLTKRLCPSNPYLLPLKSLNAVSREKKRPLCLDVYCLDDLHVDFSWIHCCSQYGYSHDNCEEPCDMGHHQSKRPPTLSLLNSERKCYCHVDSLAISL